MSVGKVITGRAPEGFREMTLHDLKEFVEAMDLAGAPDSVPVQARVTLRGTLRELRAEVAKPGTATQAQ